MSFEEVQLYVSELEKTLNDEKSKSVFLLGPILSKVVPLVEMKKPSVKKLWKKIQCYENDLLNKLCLRRIRLEIDSVIVLFSCLSGTRYELYNAYLTNCVKDPGPNALEELIQIQKKINSSYEIFISLSRK